ncbi:hypothetical protein [Nocardia ninae]|uniref:Uncharacterized protein n=1 Tax=Nocardia ninae NBRC 108245 TaxID=1210091 RepID=A0A511MN18_9NOCA|nr:hypothetical protein [Nocardia ninae]GEM41517.1 hypothetical protein NN4_60360 [Nocardia ninae NBRC 108245]
MLEKRLPAAIALAAALVFGAATSQVLADPDDDPVPSDPADAKYMEKIKYCVEILEDDSSRTGQHGDSLAHCLDREFSRLKPE